MTEPEILGTIRLTKEVEHYDYNSQVAAWWRRLTLLPGDYPVVVVEKDPMYAVVVVAARIEEEHYPSLFGGVRVDTGHDRSLDRQGEVTTLVVSAYTKYLREVGPHMHWLGGIYTPKETTDGDR